MHLDLSDRVICERLYVDGIWEREVTQFLKRLIKPGMVVLDIGGNVGYYTLLAAQLVGRDGKVVTFEPEPSRFALLEANVKANGFKNVKLVQKAVSNRKGVARLYLDPGHNPGDHQIFWFPGRASVEVPVTPVDEYLGAECPSVHLIKMDIQGAEMDALEGMRETIMKNEEIVLVTEFWPEGMKRFGFSPVEFLKKLTDYGFRLYMIADAAGSLQEVKPDVVIGRCKGEMYLVCMRGAAPVLSCSSK